MRPADSGLLRRPKQSSGPVGASMFLAISIAVVVAAAVNIAAAAVHRCTYTLTTDRGLSH